jgi:hypothetical protein
MRWVDLSTVIRIDAAASAGAASEKAKARREVAREGRIAH